MRLIAEAIRNQDSTCYISLHAIDLQLYKIFKITRVSFFWHTVYNSLATVIIIAAHTGWGWAPKNVHYALN